jgi:hypothetical protein
VAGHDSEKEIDKSKTERRMQDLKDAIAAKRDTPEEWEIELAEIEADFEHSREMITLTTEKMAEWIMQMVRSLDRHVPDWREHFMR